MRRYSPSCSLVSPGPTLCSYPLIHRSAWKRNSPKFKCKILHIPAPILLKRGFLTEASVDKKTVRYRIGKSLARHRAPLELHGTLEASVSSRQPFTWFNTVYLLVLRRTRGLREADSWFEGSRAPGLTPRTDSTFLSRAAYLPQPHRNPLQIAFQPIYRPFSWFEGSRLVV